MSIKNYVGKFILPVLKKNQCDEYPYSKSGTGIRIFHNKTHFFVTAEHVVNDTDINGQLLSRPPEEILVPESISSRNFIQLTEKIKVYSPVNSFEKDITFFKIKESSSQNASWKSDYIDCNLKSGEKLYVVGYPTQKNDVDCEGKKIKRFIKEYTARFIQKKDYFHSRISVALEDGESLDGVSGGAVFKSNMKLCGMMLRADRNGLAEFYNADAIKKIINEATKDDLTKEKLQKYVDLSKKLNYL